MDLRKKKKQLEPWNFLAAHKKINRQNEKWEKFVESRNIWSSLVQ